MSAPHTTPQERDRRALTGLHISECHRGNCNGFLGDYDTYVCICWCHAATGAPS